MAVLSRIIYEQRPRFPTACPLPSGDAKTCVTSRRPTAAEIQKRIAVTPSRHFFAGHRYADAYAQCLSGVSYVSILLNSVV